MKPLLRESSMRKTHPLLLSLSLVSAAALAGQGLTAPAAEQVWPQWQARITVGTTRLDPVALTGNLSAQPRHLIQSGALLGDYYLHLPGLRASSMLGGLRATGGLMVGPRYLAFGAAPAYGAGQRLGLSVQSTTAPWASEAYADAVPYLGIGYTGLDAKGGWGLSADFGLIASNPSGAGRVGRALLGSQSLDSSVRDLRLSPVLQIGMRYAF
ncbi:MAG: hypothetical protein KGL43_09295 [Burkholderiales bacterium]|nr:hypothetical protein [Burkholderiales bacterium]MDE2453777.1 hypothetical protein [Burkholderiales bacterium]